MPPNEGRKVLRAVRRQQGLPPEPAPETVRRPRLRRLADVRPEALRWLWPGRFLLGKLNLIGGDGGLGKSLLTIDMAARLTTGRDWPDGKRARPPMSVLFLTAEDDLADTVRPRLEAAGGDAARAYVLESVRQVVSYGGDARPEDQPADDAFSLAADLTVLEEALAEVGAGAVFIDPLTAYLGDTDSYADAKVRVVLRPLSELAGRSGAGVIGVMHLNKAVGRASQYRWTGSVAFLNSARAAQLVVNDRDDRTGARRLVIPQKQNLSERPAGLAYTIEAYPMLYDGLPLNPARIAWAEGTVEVSADEALAERDPVTEEAADFLRDLLAEGRWNEARVRQAAREAGISWSAILRAKRPAGVRSRKLTKDEHPDTPWVWELASYSSRVE